MGGSKYQAKANLNPGPGQYEQALYDMSNQQAQNTKIGTQKVRDDVFNIKKATEMPGPGAYESPDKKVPSFSIGSKREARPDNNPGVGSYNVTSELVTHKEFTMKMSMAKRDDVWKDEIRGGDTPGPGAVDPIDSNHNGGFVFNKDERFPKSKDRAPGPGTYELLDD